MRNKRVTIVAKKVKHEACTGCIGLEKVECSGFLMKTMVELGLPHCSKENVVYVIKKYGR